MGMSGWDIITYNAFIDAFSWLVETWKTSIAVKNVATVDANVDMHI